MFTVGLCVGSRERMAAHAQAGLDRCVEPDTVILLRYDQRSICRAYNEMINEAAARPNLEALVLMHEDVETRDPALFDRLRQLFVDPSVAVVGVTGARNIRQLAWWKHDRYGAVDEGHRRLCFSTGTSDVDAVDGLFLALSPLAVRELRFDERNFPGFHGYDIDFCLQARSRSWRVVVTDLDLCHHTRAGYGDRRAFWRADRALRLKWRLGNPLAIRVTLPVERLRLRLTELRRPRAVV